MAGYPEKPLTDLCRPLSSLSARRAGGYQPAVEVAPHGGPVWIAVRTRRLGVRSGACRPGRARARTRGYGLGAFRSGTNRVRPFQGRGVFAIDVRGRRPPRRTRPRLVVAGLRPAIGTRGPSYIHRDRRSLLHSSDRGGGPRLCGRAARLPRWPGDTTRARATRGSDSGPAQSPASRGALRCGLRPRRRRSTPSSACGWAATR
jgi:hypothetical protein